MKAKLLGGKVICKGGEAEKRRVLVKKRWSGSGGEGKMVVEW